MPTSAAARPNNPLEQIRAAQITVAGRARDRDDAARILGQLGIDYDPRSPAARREHARRAQRRTNTRRAPRPATAPL